MRSSSSNNPAVTEIDCSRDVYDLTTRSSSVYTVAQLISIFTTLPETVISINVGGNFLGFQNMQDLVKLFTAIPETVTSLNLENNYFDGTRLGALLAMLPPTVIFLNLTRNHLLSLKKEVELEIIVEALVKSGKQIIIEEPWQTRIAERQRIRRGQLLKEIDISTGRQMPDVLISLIARYVGLDVLDSHEVHEAKETLALNALMRAVMCQHVEAVEKLLLQGAKLCKEGGNDRLTCAPHHSDFQGLVKQRAYLDHFLMKTAVSETKSGDSIVKQLLTQINDIHHLPKQFKEEAGSPAVKQRLEHEERLLAAIRASEVNESKEVMELFSCLDLPMNYQDAQGKTALMHAIEHGKMRLVEKLLEKANIHLGLVDNYGNSALTLAAKTGNARIIQWILEKPEPQQAPRVRDLYPGALRQAADHGHVDAVVALLNNRSSLTSIAADNKETKVADSYQLIVNGLKPLSADDKLPGTPEYILARAILNNTEYKGKLLAGIDQYLRYHERNRTTFVGSLNPYHGQTGYHRALALKNILKERAGINEAALRKWLEKCSQSGNGEHSLRAYLSRAIMPREVIRHKLGR